MKLLLYFLCSKIQIRVNVMTLTYMQLLKYFVYIINNRNYIYFQQLDHLKTMHTYEVQISMRYCKRKKDFNHYFIHI